MRKALLCLAASALLHGCSLVLAPPERTGGDADTAPDSDVFDAPPDSSPDTADHDGWDDADSPEAETFDADAHDAEDTPQDAETPVDAEAPNDADTCEPAQEIAANCIDEDCNGFDLPADRSALFETTTAPSGQMVHVTVSSTHRHVCIALHCRMGDTVISDVSMNNGHAGDRHTWTFGISFPTPGQWHCVFSNKINLECCDEECISGTRTAQLCQVVEAR